MSIRKMEALLEEIKYHKDRESEHEEIEKDIASIKDAMGLAERYLYMTDVVRWAEETKDKEIVRKISLYRFYMPECRGNAQRRHERIIKTAIKLLPHERIRISWANSIDTVRELLREALHDPKDKDA